MYTIVQADLVDGVDELAAKHRVPRRLVIEAALRRFLDDPTAVVEQPADVEPPGVPQRAVEVWAALVRNWSGVVPVPSSVLAEDLQIHRGNVDRHLAVLREHGWAKRSGRGHGHVPLFTEEAAAS